MEKASERIDIVTGYKVQGENSIGYIVSGIELGKEKIQRKLQD